MVGVYPISPHHEITKAHVVVQSYLTGRHSCSSQDLEGGGEGRGGERRRGEERGGEERGGEGRRGEERGGEGRGGGRV